MNLDNGTARPRVLILGTGAMGSALGAHLARGGEADVTLAGTWTAALDAIRRDGVHVETAEGSWTQPVSAAEIEHAPAADVALVLVKSTQTASPGVARAVKRVADEGATVLTLQNGLGNREALQKAADGGHVGFGVATLGATLLGPGHVRVFPGEIVLAREGPDHTDAKLTLLSELLVRAGIPSSTSSDVGPLVWGKLAVNCALNPLAALTGLRNGALLESPRLRTLLARAAREVGDVAKALGVTLAEDPVDAAERVARATADNRSSMLQDLDRGVATEIDVLSGAVVAEAARKGVAVPVNEWLLRSVRAREAALGLRTRLSA